MPQNDNYFSISTFTPITLLSNKNTHKNVSWLFLIRLGFWSLERMGNTGNANNQNSSAEGLGIYLTVLMNQWGLVKSLESASESWKQKILQSCIYIMRKKTKA